MIGTYRKQFKAYDRIKKIFSTPVKDAVNFVKLEALFFDRETRAQIKRFRANFKVSKDDQDALKTILLCLDYFETLKALHIFSTERQLNSKNRQTNLQELIDFFGNHLIDRSTSRNEIFLVQTLEKLISIPIDVMSLQAGVGTTYSIGNTFTLANYRSLQDVKEFDNFTDDTVMIDCNHQYIYHKCLMFKEAPLSKKQK